MLFRSIGDEIKERDILFVHSPQSFGKRYNIDVRVHNEALSIDSVNKTVSIKNESGEIYTETYDKLLLSPGSVAVKPDINGIETDGIFTLKTVEDTDKIKSYINNNGIKRAVVIGGGFIGLEMAENIHHLGIDVSIVEMTDQVMGPVDYSIAAHVHQHLTAKGVSLYLNKGVTGFEKAENEIILTLNDGSTLSADMVILSIGVRPNTMLAKSAGIEIGQTGGIKVNEYLETSVSDIFAVGDVIEYEHPILKTPYLNNLATPANRQGRIVADNMAKDIKTAYEGAIASAVAKVFDLTVATTGVPAKRLSKMGIKYASSTTHGHSHASYYPDSFPLTIKITFDPNTGTLYGAQGVGVDGIDKRIDQAALVIKNGGTIYDLMRIEQCYAPPFSSAKDPIAIAGYVAGNIISGDMPVIYWNEIDKLNPDKSIIVDVRTPEEFAFGAIKGSVNIPLDEIRERLGEFPNDKDIILTCAVGVRGNTALRILIGHGFKNVRNLSGGYKTYSVATAAIKNPAKNKPTMIQNNQQENNEDKSSPKSENKNIKINACGLQCPGPVVKIKQAMDTLSAGDTVEITATDPGFSRDAEAWCKSTGNKLVSNYTDKGKYIVTVEKSSPKCELITHGNKNTNGKTFIMFSDDLDKALATFVLANGAAATGAKVTIFFTFWGLNVIKKVSKPKVSKDIFGKMFGFMLPSHSGKLSLSKMSMFGAGDKMMRHIMNNKNIESLENLRQMAIDAGVEFIACQMSMDVMGVDKAELLDNVTIGGVATYMQRADEANVNLFI